jgi:hypothetical protein
VAYAIAGNVFPEPRGERGRILRIVSFGGLAVFALGFTTATVMYYLSANGTVTYGRLGYDQYTNIVTMILGILALTTSGVTTYIFAAKKVQSTPSSDSDKSDGRHD